MNTENKSKGNTPTEHANASFHRLARQEEANQPDGEVNLQQPAESAQPAPPPANQPHFQIRDLNEQEEY